MTTRRASMLLFGAIAAAAAGAGEQRTVTSDDLYRLEEVGDTALSPDGKWLAYAVRRPLTGETMFKRDFLFGNDRGDVWLVPVAEGKARRITDGASDGSGFWAPAWSPDGERLALLSTRGGNVRPWLWDRASGTLRPLTDRGVEWWGGNDASVLLWVSKHELVFSMLPAGQRPLALTAEIKAAETAMREWPKAWRGRETTASVLDSGLPVDFTARPQGQLVALDVTKGTTGVLASGIFRGPRLAPDGRSVAFLKQTGINQPRPDRLVEGAERAYDVGVVGLAPGAKPHLAGARDSVFASHRWSPDGSFVAFLGKPGAIDALETRVFRLRAADGAAEVLSGPELEPTSLVWTADSRLLALATPKASPGAKSRPDWWLLAGGAPPRNVTERMKSAPAALIAAAGGGVVGVAGGDVWKIDLDGSPPRNLTAEFEPKVTTIVWPEAANPPAEGVRELVLGVQRERLNDLHRLDFDTARVAELAKPDAEATLTAFGPAQRAAILTANTRRGTSLWLSKPAFEGHRLVLETNTFLREIGEGALRKIDYRGLEGDELKAWLILPPGYQEGTRYPLVAWIYAGRVARDIPPIYTSLNYSQAFNLQLLAARGYAVLLPSMPLGPSYRFPLATKEPIDPFMELTKGVLPALDKAIELGIADPKRLGVMGASLGGFSTYGIIAQTTRFKAAVAIAGPSDFVSMYGEFDARFRYDPVSAHELTFRMMSAETGQHGMGNPPWKDAARYMRNSPISYVDRVTTPLMIVQGDMDFVGIQQGEEFFTALYRQAKRVRFVRYWGEGHAIRSPANVRDMWQRIGDWFDEHLKLGPGTPPTAQP